MPKAAAFVTMWRWRWRLPIPQWLILGCTRIVEEAVDETHFVMDFRVTHPLLGQVFRYAGKFAAAVS